MNKVIKILSIVIVVAVIILYSINYFLFMPNIKLMDKKTILLNYKEKYIEPGYKALDHNKDVTDKIKVDGEVNSNKLGRYKIKYFIKKGLFTKTVTRVVKVRDLTPPKLILKDSSKTVNICPGSEYKEEAYSAYDNYDKDITEKVKVTKSEDNVKYAVVDNSGNYTVIRKKIKKKDNKSPVIKLKSNDTIFVYLNEEFKDPGYEVSDNCDKSIKEKVKVEGSVDTSTLGSYKLVYKVRDTSGNSEEKERVVNVVKKGSPGTIYLTFDDGPRADTTNVILDILKEEEIKATFFVTNRGPDFLIKREYEEGHTVGLHTASHDYSIVYNSVESYFNDLQIVHDRVKNLTGNDPKVIRFPGGSSNTVSRKYQPGIMSILTKEVVNRGYRYYDWNINSGDAGEYNTKDEIYKSVTSKLSHDKVNVVLMHDIKTYTRDALKDIIKYGKDNGYRFEAITDKDEMITQKVNN